STSLPARPLAGCSNAFRNLGSSSELVAREPMCMNSLRFISIKKNSIEIIVLPDSAKLVFRCTHILKGYGTDKGSPIAGIGKTSYQLGTHCPVGLQQSTGNRVLQFATLRLGEK